MVEDVMQSLEVEVLLNFGEGAEEEMQKRDENNKNQVLLLLLVNFCRKQLIVYEFVSVSKKTLLLRFFKN